MFASYAVESIGPRTIDRAYPLARIGGSALTQREWREFCRSLAVRPIRGEAHSTEQLAVVVACNTQGYVKGLCIYSVRDDSSYGRLLDVPIFVVASAGDGEGVATELVRFLRSECDISACSGIRFWTMEPDAWARRLTQEAIGRTDHGLFLPARASVAEMGRALCAYVIGGGRAIDQLSR